MKDIIQKIEEQERLGSLEEIILDDMQIVEINNELKEKLEQIDDLLCLSMNNCGLKTLKNFPNCQGLLRLELGENQFESKDLQYIQDLDQLQSLTLNKCNIEQYKDLEPLQNLQELIQLDCSETKLSILKDYHEKVFEMMKKLCYLDNKDREGNELEEEDEYDDEEDYDDDDEYEEDSDMDDEESDEEENKKDRKQQLINNIIYFKETTKEDTQ